MNETPVPNLIEPQRINFGINDLVYLHNYLINVKEPSEKIKTCTTKVETHIAFFVNSLQSGTPTQ